MPTWAHHSLRVLVEKEKAMTYVGDVRPDKVGPPGTSTGAITIIHDFELSGMVNMGKTELIMGIPYL